VANRRAAGLTGANNFVTAFGQCPVERERLGALARSFAAFKCDEKTRLSFCRHVVNLLAACVRSTLGRAAGAASAV